MKDRIVLALKGFCMGLADIVPGVSGGTMALVLGIYTQFIEALRGLNLRFIRPLGRAIRGGFKAQARAELIEHLRAMQLGWLLTLGLGIGTAIVIGSRVIPDLMARYPEVMLSLFFGLILASIAFPLKMIERRGWREAATGVVGGVLAFVVVGAQFTPPLDWHPVEVAAVEDGGQTLKAVSEAGPSAFFPEQVINHPRNAEVRATLDLEARAGLDPKAHDNPYNTVVIPAGTTVQVPRPAPWFILIAGFIAICAMLLPGISGSFILLAMGSYFFVLNALKGLLKGLVHLDVSGAHLMYVGLFVVGALAGVIAFSRLLSWLLRRYPSVTMAALAGVMIGCLRTIWPFKHGLTPLDQRNVLPTEFGASGQCAALGADATPCWTVSTFWTSIGAVLLGIALVVVLAVVAKRVAGPQTPDSDAATHG